MTQQALIAHLIKSVTSDKAISDFLKIPREIVAAVRAS